MERISAFLDAYLPGAGAEALDTIKAALGRLEAFPGLGRPTDDSDVREIVVPFRMTAYLIRYSVLPEDGSVLVMRVWHGREKRS